MDELIPIVGKLQDVLGGLGQTSNLNLPQIVVIGGQSSGKSSVLEALVGRSFLPRGSGIVTRRPLVLQLLNTRSPEDEEGSKEEWGEFLHIAGKRFHDFNAIRDEIVRETERVTGKNKGISSDAIHLKIYSCKVMQLTLIDLPGIAKVAIGDQPENIEDQIRAMCMSFIENPNAIILAVTSANTDLANSDALKMAREVDTSSSRTIGVLTKLDLMDPGTDVNDVLANKLIPLRRGYIAVVNRGQLDIDNNVSIKDGLEKEKSYFRKNPTYRAMHHRCGTANLAKSLNSILMHQIRDCLPELKNRIISMITDVHRELDSLGEPVTDTTSASIGRILLGLLSRFSASFTDCIEGRGSSCDGVEMDEMYGGARIAFIFNEVFVRSLMAIHPFDGLTDDEIRTTICNANGTRSALFVPEISFELLVRRQISRLEQPGLQCVDFVFDELQRISSQCEPSEFTKFPVLRSRLVEVISQLLRKAVIPTQMMVSNLIKIELAYINTSHPDFIGGSRAVAQFTEKLSSNPKPTNTTAHIDHHEPDANNIISDMGLYDTDNHEFQTPNQHIGERQLNATANGSSDGGKLMNFIFRSNNPSVESTSNVFRSPTIDPPTIVQLPQIPDTMRCRSRSVGTDRERIETEIIKSLIESYFSIVRKNFIDLVPKTIMYFLVNHAKDSMQNQLVTELYRDCLIPDLMKEADGIAQRRTTCREMKDLLDRAMEIVNEVRDFNSF